MSAWDRRLCPTIPLAVGQTAYPTFLDEKPRGARWGKTGSCPAGMPVGQVGQGFYKEAPTIPLGDPRSKATSARLANTTDGGSAPPGREGPRGIPPAPTGGGESRAISQHFHTTKALGGPLMANSKQKPTKRAPKAAQNTSNGALIDEAKHLYRRLLDAVDEKIRAGEVNSTVLREAAAVMRAAATLDGEDRAREKMRLQFARALQPSVVVEYLAGLSEAEVQRLFREVARRRGVIEGSGNVLDDYADPTPRRSGLA